MRSPENFELERNINQAFEKKKLEELYQYARLGEAEGDRVQEDDFNDIYSAEDIAHDRAYVAGRKKQAAEELARLPDDARHGQEEARKLAYLMEVMLVKAGELWNWFGSAAHTKLASEYDDWHNGVDAIVEFEADPSKYLALAVDFTLPRGSQSKIRGIKEDIDRGHMAEVKYFDPESEAGGLKNLAKVVVSCDVATLLDAAVLWKKEKKSKEEKLALVRHPIQVIILREIQAQLAAFRDYARETGKKKFDALYTDNLAMIDAIIGEKEEEKIMADPEQDGAFRNLKHMLAAEIPIVDAGVSGR